MAKNSFKATEPYPVTAPGNGNGVDKSRWTRSYHDIMASQSLMSSRDRRRRFSESRESTDSPLIRQLNAVGGKRHGKTGAQMHPPYGIHSSKPIVRKAVKAWRKRVMAESNESKV